MGRRKSRFDHLSDAEREAAIRDALALRKTIIDAQRSLVPFNAQYTALHELTEAIDRALTAVTGREPDYLAADLGYR
ncbi:hypothetical protein [Nitratireductor sp. GCM10026969]|uniref:hypothetical protein n=1 Tax=Nitratireductor sp. GCM10026969 TaxID=3252645 RepID=UPI00360D29AD